MQAKRRRWWPLVKAAIGLVVLFFIGQRFARDLAEPELYREPVAVGWLVLSGLLYLAGMGMSGLYWWRLLYRLGYPAPAGQALRAYYLSQPGKYVPGKAVALLLRVGLVRDAGVPAGVGGLTTFYEVLVTMAAGSLLAVVFGWLAPGFQGPGSVAESADLHAREVWVARWQMLQEGVIDSRLLPLFALPLVAVTLVPVLPPVFNWLVRTVALPFRRLATGPLPAVSWGCLVEGLTLTAVGWLLLGSSVAVALLAVPAQFPWGPGLLVYLIAALAASLVAGFVVVIAPGGLGVRELLLTACLTAAALAPVGESDPLGWTRGQVTLVVLLLRVAWTAAEGLAAALLYFLRHSPPLVRT